MGMKWNNIVHAERCSELKTLKKDLQTLNMDHKTLQDAIKNKEHFEVEKSLYKVLYHGSNILTNQIWTAVGRTHNPP